MDEREETLPSALETKNIADATDSLSPSPIPLAEFSWSVTNANQWHAIAPNTVLFDTGFDAGLSPDLQQTDSSEALSDVGRRLEEVSRAESAGESGASAFVRQNTNDAGPERGQIQRFDRDDQGRSFDVEVAAPVQPETYTAPQSSWKIDTGGDTLPTLSRAFTPLDDLFDNEQWHLLNTGQFNGVPGIDINVTSVWDDYTGTCQRL